MQSLRNPNSVDGSSGVLVGNWAPPPEVLRRLGGDCAGVRFSTPANEVGGDSLRAGRDNSEVT